MGTTLVRCPYPQMDAMYDSADRINLACRIDHDADLVSSIR
jgi:hypothetical protein